MLYKKLYNLTRKMLTFMMKLLKEGELTPIPDKIVILNDATF